MSTKTELDALANFIMAEVPGEPSQSEGAGHTAIRIIRDQRARIEALELAVRWAQQYFWRIGEKAAEAMMSAALRDAQHE